MLASTAHETAAELLNRYPHVTRPERELLIAIFPKLSNVDIAMMLSDEALGPKLEAFRRDNAASIRTPIRQYAVLVFIAVLGVLGVIWSLMGPA